MGGRWSERQSGKCRKTGAVPEGVGVQETVAIEADVLGIGVDEGGEGKSAVKSAVAEHDGVECAAAPEVAVADSDAGYGFHWAAVFE